MKVRHVSQTQTPIQNKTQTKLKLVEIAEKLLKVLEEKARNGDVVAMNSIALVKEFIDNIDTPKTHLRVSDSLNVYLRKLLPKTIKKVIAIKQHLNDLYKNGHHVVVITARDHVVAETPKSTIRVKRDGNIMDIEFKRRKEPEVVNSVELVLDSEEVAEEVFNLIKEAVTNFKFDVIDYKLISLIAKHSVSQYSYTLISYLS